MRHLDATVGLRSGSQTVALSFCVKLFQLLCFFLKASIGLCSDAFPVSG